MRTSVAGRLGALQWQAIRQEIIRLTTGLIGPISIAGTQFLATMLLWRAASPAEFGYFSFALLVIQLSFGLSNALVGTPLSVAPRDPHWPQVEKNCLSVHALLLGGLALAMPAALWLTGARSDLVSLALLAVTANLRWGARSWAIAREEVAVSARADCAYAMAAVTLLMLATITNSLNVGHVTNCLTAANIFALLAFNSAFLARQIDAIKRPALALYRKDIWPNQVRWSLSGVLTTEASGNAHGYLVTGMAGAAAFAPLAFASLFCRPMTIYLSAITQIDRPVFARLLGSNDRKRLHTMMQRSFVSAGLIWFGNAVIAALVLAYGSSAIASRGYDMNVVRSAIACWFAIMALRSLRNPMATVLQARGAFKILAACSFGSAVISIAAVYWLAVSDPLHSLIGIVAGEAVLLGGILLAFVRTKP